MPERHDNLLYDTPVHAPTAHLDASSGKNLPPKCGKRRPVRIVPAAGMWDESASSQANLASRPSPPPIDELGPSHDASGALLFEPARDAGEHST